MCLCSRAALSREWARTGDGCGCAHLRELQSEHVLDETHALGLRHDLVGGLLLRGRLHRSNGARCGARRESPAVTRKRRADCTVGAVGFSFHPAPQGAMSQLDPPRAPSPPPRDSVNLFQVHASLINPLLRLVTSRSSLQLLSCDPISSTSRGTRLYARSYDTHTLNHRGSRSGRTHDSWSVCTNQKDCSAVRRF